VKCTASSSRKCSRPCTAETPRQARQQKKNLKSYIRELQREGRVHGIRMSLLTAKVLDFLTKEAKVTVDEQ